MVNKTTTSTKRSSRKCGSIITILLLPSLCAERKRTKGNTNNLSLLEQRSAGSSGLFLALALLQEGLGDQDLILSGNGAVQRQTVTGQYSLSKTANQRILAESKNCSIERRILN
jgi:hypothetical protein